MEMSNKLSHWESELAPSSLVNIKRDILADAESALVGLGFRLNDATRALAQIEEPGEEVETLIKQALKALA